MRATVRCDVGAGAGVTNMGGGAGQETLTILFADVEGSTAFRRPHDRPRPVAGFYGRVFDAEPVIDLIDKGVRSALIDVGAAGFLHAFEVPPGQIPLAGRPKYQRGHLDHIALSAPTQEIFRTLRHRALEAGATNGHVRDFGVAWGMKFRDPDGMEGDLMWADPEPSLTALRRYADAPIAPWSKQA